MMIAVKYRKGMSVSGVPATEAYAELERIRDKHGGELRKADIVTASRGKNSLFHNHFEWNDKRAAQKHREAQAGQLIRSIVVYNPEENREMGPVFVSVQGDDGDRAYVTTEEAVSEESTREQVVRDALRGLQGWQKRYGFLSEVQPITRAIDRVRKKLEKDDE